MGKWKFWDWVPYSLLGCSIVIDAIEQAHKRSATLHDYLPGFVTGMDWGLIALALFILATVVFIFRQLGWVGAASVSSQPIPQTAAAQPTLLIDE